jgi:hypothetical protein
MFPAFNKATQSLHTSSIKLAKMDATAYMKIANRYKVNGYPSLKLFYSTSTDPKYVRDYTGGRKEAKIISWVRENEEKLKQENINQIMKRDLEEKSSLTCESGAPYIFVDKDTGFVKYEERKSFQLTFPPKSDSWKNPNTTLFLSIASYR